MNNYLVTHEVVAGRSEGNDHPPIIMKVYTIVEAESSEQAQDRIVQYSDPTFKSKMMDISEMGDEVSVAELKELMKPDEVFKSMT